MFSNRMDNLYDMYNRPPDACMFEFSVVFIYDQIQNEFLTATLNAKQLVISVPIKDLTVLQHTQGLNTVYCIPG